VTKEKGGSSQKRVGFGQYDFTGSYGEMARDTQHMQFALQTSSTLPPNTDHNHNNISSNTSIMNSNSCQQSCSSSPFTTGHTAYATFVNATNNTNNNNTNNINTNTSLFIPPYTFDANSTALLVEDYDGYDGASERGGGRGGGEGDGYLTTDNELLDLDPNFGEDEDEDDDDT
jgi:hypothetical protein